MFGAIFLVLFFVVLFLPANRVISNTCLFALPQKHLLLKNTPGPRIILIGGSNLSYGIDSRMIRDSLHLNPINCGIHACIGLNFMLEDYYHYVRENDIVVIAPEYNHFYGDFADGDINLLSILVDISPQYSDCSRIQLLKLLKSAPEYGCAKLKLWNYFAKTDTIIIDPNDKRGFNEFGDNNIHWTMTKEKNIKSMSIDGALNKELFKRLKDFETKLKKKHVTMYITFPSFQQTSFNMQRGKIDTIESMLKANDFSILGTADRYKMDDSLMFDTAYHLTKNAADHRTALLIEDLKMAIKENKDRQ